MILCLYKGATWGLRSIGTRLFFFFGGGGGSDAIAAWKMTNTVPDWYYKGLENDQYSSWFQAFQRSQYPLMKEHTLNHNIKAPIV